MDNNRPFELYFEWKEIKAFSYGKPCLKTSNNFSNFDKVVLTITANSMGNVSFFQCQLINDGQTLIKKDIPVSVWKGDKVEFTVTKTLGCDNLDGYSVRVHSEAEIKEIVIECITNNETQVKIDMPVKFLHEESLLKQMLKVCHYCLKEDCKCGAEKWIYIEIPVIKI